jgi:hypothetical protein
MEEYVSKLGKVLVYSAEEFLGTPYAEYVRRHVSEGFVVLVLPDPKLTGTKQSSYFFNHAKSEREAIELFIERAGENAKTEKWLGKILKTIEFH